MKKLLSLGLALTMCSTVLIGTADAYTATMDSMNQASTVSVARNRQANYLEALRLRYKNMYNQERRDRNYYNSYLQKNRLNFLKQENNVVGNLNSKMTREGDMEEGRERVRTVDRYRVQAVNAKQTFRKAAVNYYLDGGDGYSSAEAMEMGNVDGMTNVVPRKRMVDAMYKMHVGATNLTTRDMVRNLGMHSGETGITKPSTYRTGQFHGKMLSPYMSTRWMN